MKTIELCKATRAPHQECRAKLYGGGGGNLAMDIEARISVAHGEELTTYHFPISPDEAREFGLALISAADSLTA